MITLYSNGRYYQYLYDESTRTYLYISRKENYCSEGSCKKEDFFEYRKNCWEDFEEWWTPQELLAFVEGIKRD